MLNDQGELLLMSCQEGMGGNRGAEVSKAKAEVEGGERICNPSTWKLRKADRLS